MKSLLLICLLISALVNAQSDDYSTSAIPDSLRQNANAVVRLEHTDVAITSQRDMTVNYKRVVTVFNEKGLHSINAVEDYGKKKSIRNIHATVYDASGKEIKKIKRKDFKDVTPNGGSLFYSDYRILYFEYTPVQYPFTIVYECETNTSNTAFIRPWTAIDNFYTGVQKSVIDIRFPENLGFKKKEFNFWPNISKTNETATSITYTAVNIPAQKPEDLCPDYVRIFPRVIFGLEHFNLEGVDGSAKTWKDFGLWYSQQILAGTEELPETTRTKIKSLVGAETDPLKKARIVYEYVQQKSRYVSIQVGIGGWKPMPAADVDRLGYGDCKALTNYTKALLDAVDVPSYYTVVYGDSDITNIESDFVSMQGNHAILTIPSGDDYIGLECTSQDTPFGYQAKFTDDRNVLLIKPEGGEIVHTKTYNERVNSQMSKGHYVISESGTFSGSIAIITEGSQYRYHLQNMPPLEREAHYKEYWNNINNLKITKSIFADDRNKVSFTENLEFEAENYGNFSGSRMMFPVNAYNAQSASIKRFRNRKMPFEIARGSYDEDEIKIELPHGFDVEALPKDFELSGKYGHYRTQLVQSDEKHLVYKRSFLLKKGQYPSNEYEDFRQFMEQVSRNDNAKIVLIKNQ